MMKNSSNTFKKLWKIFTPFERKRMKLFFLTSTLMTMFEVFCVSLVPIYINWVIKGNSVLKIYDFKIDKVTLGVVIASVTLLGSWVSYRILKDILIFSQLVGARVSSNIFEHSLYSKSASQIEEIISNATLETDRFSSFVITPVLFIFSRAVLAFSLFFAMCFFFFKATILSFLIVFLVFYIVFRSSRGVLSNFGKNISEANSKRVDLINDTFLSRKEIVLSENELTFLSEYNKSALNYAKSRSMTEVVSKQPRYIFEAIVFFFGVVGSLLLSESNVTDPMGFLLFFGLLGYKLMPAVHQIQSFYSIFRANVFVLHKIYSLCEGDKENIDLGKVNKSLKCSSINNIEILHMDIMLQGKIISYKNMLIEKGKIFQLIGASGSGKSTFIEALLGFLDYKYIIKFDCRVNSKPIAYKDFVDLIRANSAYCPQKVKLLGKDYSQSLFIPEIDYIYKKLPNNIWLNFVKKSNFHSASGGEIQRVGIARSILQDKEIYFFDESFSGIDPKSRELIFSDIKKISNDAIVVFVSHDNEDSSLSDAFITIS